MTTKPTRCASGTTPAGSSTGQGSGSHSERSIRIIQGDALTVLRSLPDESVHCVVTSPPYWGLRDFGVPGQLGLEPTLGEHIEAMVAVFREVRRVLRKDGTCWLNYGDCYATAPNGRSAADTKAAGNDDRTFRDKPFSTVGPIYSGQHDIWPKGRRSGDISAHAHGTLKPKDLCMIPNRLAIALQDDGWWVRSEIIWHKPNPMPESIRDRPAVAHEKIFLLTKSARYFYDAEAVRVPPAESSVARWAQDVESQEGGHRANGGRKTNGTMKAVGSDGANLRNVWTVPTRGYREAHFATFPPEIPERCIKAGCPPGGVVLDPFAGAGTVGLVADRLQRSAILIELNPEYCDMARKRLEADHGMFGHVLMEHADG